MDVEQISTLIGSLGFPIVMCGALFWNMTKIQHKLTETINNNTQALLLLNEQVRDLQEKVKEAHTS